MMKLRWLLLIPIVLASVVVFVLFVPVVLDPSFASGGTAMVCHASTCISFVQYDSISYLYGGWGAYFQTGVNYYTVQGWTCFCPPEQPGHYVPCCVPPYAGVVWPVVYSLLAGAVASTAVLFWKPSHQKSPAKL